MDGQQRKANFFHPSGVRLLGIIFSSQENHKEGRMNTKIVIDNDVISGGDNHGHHGNKRYYRLILRFRRKEYAMAQNDAERDSIVKRIYKLITVPTPQARFVERNKDGSYTVKNKVFALRKIKEDLGRIVKSPKGIPKRRNTLTITKQDWLKIHSQIEKMDESEKKRIEKRRHSH
jgi:hypothetical protein